MGLLAREVPFFSFAFANSTKSSNILFALAGRSTPERSKSSKAAPTYQPRLSSPTRFFLGTLTLSNVTRPLYASHIIGIRSTVTPSVSNSESTKLIPLCLGASGSALAIFGKNCSFCSSVP